MALDMKCVCERCEKPLDWESDAFICSFECTFCIDCAEELDWICSKCGGELSPRPRRAIAS